MKKIALAAAIIACGIFGARAGCNEISVQTNAMFIHATVECGKNYMDTPAGYYALAMTRQCSGLGEAKLRAIAKKAMADFDNAAKRNGKKYACKLTDNLEKAVVEDATEAGGK